MIANDTFVGCFGSTAPGDGERLSKIVVGAVRSGFAVVLDKPGQKVPLCTLTAAQSKAADLEAQEAAKAAGDRSWARRRHACGLHHALTDDKEAARVTSRLIKRLGQLNVGIELGRSRMVVVDVDTAAEKEAFLAAWSTATGQDMAALPPTVLSPGSALQDAHGNLEWIHRDGGHYWFTLPDGMELPTSPGVLKGEGGWAVMWHGKQVLVPPSVRAEGAYTLVGQPSPLPAWLRDFIQGGAARVEAKRRETAARVATTDSPIDVWAAQASWSDILEPDDWTDTGKADACGCPVWTAPGEHASPKSATAHEVGCDVYATELGHGPLHVWTDNPPEWVAAAVAAKGSRTITKPTYLAFRLHGGDLRAFLSSVGVGGQRPPADVWKDESAPVKESAPGKPAAAVENWPATLLPPQFWESRPELLHIRQAAWSRCMPADPVLHGVLARLSSLLAGTTRTDTGILTPASLNYFAAVVGDSGLGKSSSSRMAARLLPVPEILRQGGRYMDNCKIGSGEGLVERFMGTREESTGEQYATGPRKGEDKTRTVRGQVRSNALFYVDEGMSLITLMGGRSGSTLGETLRDAWTGGVLGQDLATAERSRRAEDYALGMIVGFQPASALPLLTPEETVLGTPQRFVWCRIGGEGMPLELPEWPGELETDPALFGSDPFDPEPVPLTLSVEPGLAAQILATHQARNRGECMDCSGLDSHRPLTFVKIASLLAVLAGRTEVGWEDWALAQMVWDASVAVRTALLRKREQEAEQLAEAKRAALVAQAMAVQEATGGLDPFLDRLARAVRRYVDKGGPMTPGELYRRFSGDDRKRLGDSARVDRVLEYAAGQDWIAVLEDGTVGPGGEKP